MVRWPFIVLIVFNVILVQITHIKSSPATGDGSLTTGYMARAPWDTGFTAAIDGLTSGISTVGHLLGQTSLTIFDHAFQSLGMLISGSLGMGRTNFGTRNFSDNLGPNSMVPLNQPNTGTPATQQPSGSQPVASQPGASQPGGGGP